MLDSHTEAYHLKVTKAQIGKYCILPGDPGRCELIASFLENPKFISFNREFCIWEGFLNGEKVTVCSTGIGGPSSAIAVEELALCGADAFIRVGTCGGISLSVKCGDCVIATGAVRQDGTSREYAPIEFPAVSDFSVTTALVSAAEKLGYSFHTGVVQAKDSFYGQHSPEIMPTSYELLDKWESWKRLGVLASEMESATIFTVAARLGARAGAVFTAVWNQERANAGLDTPEDEIHDCTGSVKIAVQAVARLIEKDKNQ